MLKADAAEAARATCYFEGLDAIRGIAAILVVLRHVPFMRVFSHSETFLAVDLFFLLSGVVLCNAYENRLRADTSVRDFTALRVTRLFPLYLFGSCLGLISITMGFPAPSGNLTNIVLSSMFMIPCTGKDMFPLDTPSWSLLFELIASIAYAILIRFADRRVTRAILLLIVCLSAGALIGESYSHAKYPLDIGWQPHTMVGGLYRVGFSFSTGVLLCHALQRSRRAFAGGTMTASVVLASIALLLLIEPPARLRGSYEVALILFAFPALVYAMISCRINETARHLFKYLGRLSFPLYAIHQPVAHIVTIVAIGNGVRLSDHAAANGLLLMSSLIALSLLLEKTFDRPLRTTLNAALNKRETRRAATSTCPTSTSLANAA